VSLRSAARLWQILRVARRYRLDALLEGVGRSSLPAAAFALVPVRRIEPGRPEGERVRLALQELGPIFVKFGQVLSTRRDLLPPEVADELARLRDQVEPFPGAEAVAIVEQQLGRSLAEAFARFDTTPLASASIAQVHAATLHDGREVVVKVLRPGIRRRIAEDIGLLRSLAGLVQRHHPRGHRIRPLAVVEQVEATLDGELDLQREGANASVLRRNWLGSDEMYVPEVLWSHSAERVLTLERVHGIPSDDIAALDAAGVNRPRLAERFVRVFYTQVFRDNFFHADAHAGNIWVDPDPARRDNPRLVALDFGIVGQLPDRDQYYLAENFMAMFKRDYRRIAELHVEAGWMPATVNLEELEAATRAVCEPYFTRPLSEISLGEVVFKLFRTAQRYELTLQPQLILLQKTLLNIEGVGRLLDPKLDIWSVAHPVLERILRERYSAANIRAQFRRRLPEILTHAPDMPRLVREWLRIQVEGESRVDMHSAQIAQLVEVSRQGQRRTVFAVIGAGLLLSAALLQGLGVGTPGWLGVTWPAWVGGGAALAAFIAAWPRG